jgi:hypothetical protein
MQTMVATPNRLGSAAIAFRAFHAIWAVLQLASLAYLWATAARRRRGRFLPIVVGFLLVEGAALVIGRGNCPLGPFQRTLGDPVPLFELVLPRRAAKAAVPVLAGVTIAALIAVAVRPPSSAQGQRREREDDAVERIVR